MDGNFIGLGMRGSLVVTESVYHCSGGYGGRGRGGGGEEAESARGFHG